MIHASHQRSVDVAKAEAQALRGDYPSETEREKMMLLETGTEGGTSWKIATEGEGIGIETAKRVAAKRGTITIEKGLESETETGIEIGIGGG